MKTGSLRHRITIQKSLSSRDSFGADVPDWEDVATVWASVEPLSGREFFAAKQINAEISTKITLRYLTGVQSEMRIVFKDRVFNIITVINSEERNISLVLMCKELIGSG